MMDNLANFTMVIKRATPAMGNALATEEKQQLKKKQNPQHLTVLRVREAFL
jgi:hypothetical protein